MGMSPNFLGCHKINENLGNYEILKIKKIEKIGKIGRKKIKEFSFIAL